jgi:hypothetical protein
MLVTGCLNITDPKLPKRVILPIRGLRASPCPFMAKNVRDWLQVEYS